MDIIIVEKREDMERIVSWARDFVSATPPENLDFKAPFKKAEIRFLCYGAALTCETRHGVTHFTFRARDMSVSASDYEYWGEFSAGEDFRVFGKKYANSKCELYEREHNAFQDELLQYWLALMLLALYYKSEFERTRQSVEATKAAGKKSGKGKKAKPPKMLYTRKYVISGGIVDGLPKPVKHHAKPDHEFSVRGHFRTYPSGKCVWIKPHVRCQGRGQSSDNHYIAALAEPRSDSDDE